MFYTYENDQKENGLCDMEDLTQETHDQNSNTLLYISGPHPVEGSNQFVIIYQNINTDQVPKSFSRDFKTTNKQKTIESNS